MTRALVEPIPNHHLPILIGRACISFGDIERDGAFVEARKDRFGEFCQAQPSFDKAAGFAKAFGHAVKIVALTHKMLERADFIADRHVQPLIILHQRDFGMHIGTAFEQIAGNFDIRLPSASFDEALHSTQTPPTCRHQKARLLFLVGGRHEILQ